MKKRLCILIMTIFMLTCAACGGNLETTVNLNSDLSGTRVMTLSITKSDFEEYVNGSIEDVDATIAANVPASMSYKLTSDENNYVANFTMDFSSPEDEAAKIMEIMNDGNTYTVDCIVSDSVFCKGFAYEENVAAESLMGWLETLLVNSGYVDSSDKSYIIENSSSKVAYGNDSIDGGSYIEASTMEYVTIEEMRIFTTVNADGTYNRTMEMDITDANLSINSDGVKAFMEESVPAGAEAEWTNDLGLNTHSVKLENVSAADLQNAMNTYGHTSKSVFTTGTIPEEDSYKTVLLAENACFDEHLDMSQYGCNSAGTVEVFYYVEGNKVNGNLKAAEDEVDGVPSFSEYYARINDNYPEFDQFDLYDIRDIDINYVGQYYYHIGGGSWDTTVKNAKKISREITLLFDDGTTVEQSKALADRVNELTKTSAEKLDIKAEAVEEDESNGIKIVMSGNALEVEAAMNYLTGMERSNSISYAEENKWLGFKNACVFNESVNFDGLIYKEYGNEYWDIDMDYSLDMPGSNPNKDSYDETQYDAKTGKIIGIVSTADSISKGAVTYKFNGMAIVWILVLLASIACFLVGVVMIIVGFMKKSKEKSVAVPQAAAPVAQAPVAQPTEVTAPVEQAPVAQPTETVPVAEVSETAVSEETATTENTENSAE